MEAHRPTPDDLDIQPRIILSSEFASRINALTGIMPDEQQVASLVAPWHSMANYRTRKEEYAPPSPQWHEFMESLDPQELSVLTTLLDRTMWRIDCKTVGDLRKFSSSRENYYGVGPRGKLFVNFAFRKSEELGPQAQE